MRRLLPVFIIICSISVSTMVAQELDHTKYRTYDGTYNNLQNINWGANGDNLQFLISPAYPDGMSAPVGMDRPNPRELSSDIFSQNRLFNDPLKLSDYCWVNLRKLHAWCVLQRHDPMHCTIFYPIAKHLGIKKFCHIYPPKA